MSQDQEPEKLSKKEYAKKLRREAYQRAKEYKKNDPKEKERKERAKEQRREAYQKAKARSKAQKKEKKPSRELKEQIMLASELDTRPMAPVISLDSMRRKLAEKKSPPAGDDG